MLIDVASPPTFLEGHEVLADVVRLFIIVVGVALSMIAAKIALLSLRDREFERGFGALAFALIVVTPSISGIYRFGEPLILWTTVTYLAGLSAGVVATCFRITLRWPWWRRRVDRLRQRRSAPRHR